jgi:hypothetical protein
MGSHRVMRDVTEETICTVRVDAECGADMALRAHPRVGQFRACRAFMEDDSKPPPY